MEYGMNKIIYIYIYSMINNEDYIYIYIYSIINNEENIENGMER